MRCGVRWRSVRLDYIEIIHRKCQDSTVPKVIFCSASPRRCAKKGHILVLAISRIYIYIYRTLVVYLLSQHSLKLFWTARLWYIWEGFHIHCGGGWKDVFAMPGHTAHSRVHPLMLCGRHCSGSMILCEWNLVGIWLYLKTHGDIDPCNSEAVSKKCYTIILEGLNSLYCRKFEILLW